MAWEAASKVRLEESPKRQKIGSPIDSSAELAGMGVKLGFVRAMDKAQESIVVAALARFFSDGHVHLPHQCGQDLPFSCQKRETTNISMRFSSTVHRVSVPYTIMVNILHGLEETA